MKIYYHKSLRKFTSFGFREFATSPPPQKSSPPQQPKSKELLEAEFNKIFEYAKENLVYKCGNPNDIPSRFGMFRRWRMEKQINYHNTKHPIFLYAYRAFIDAIYKKDKITLGKMCERNLYRKIDKNLSELEKLNAQLYLVADNIKIKYKLLDTKIITGDVYIDRQKNSYEDLYNVSEENPDKITIKRKKEIQTDFQTILKDRKPIETPGNAPGKDTSSTVTNDISIIQVDLQFSSNLRLGICHKEDPSLTIGIPKEYSKEYEYHSLRFERYFKLPLEIKAIRDKQIKEAMNDPKRLQQLKDEEIFNPWIITDLDYSLDGNPFLQIKPQ